MNITFKTDCWSCDRSISVSSKSVTCEHCGGVQSPDRIVDEVSQCVDVLRDKRNATEGTPLSQEETDLCQFAMRIIKNRRELKR
tara:strand:+ start:1264 stop:1515 length:252 start_codon:yes stop_codon:yes gene_type:complete